MRFDNLLEGIEQSYDTTAANQWETWTQADGIEISVGAMTEQHLRNTLNAILRRRRERIEKEFESTVHQAVYEPAWWRKYDEG